MVVNCIIGLSSAVTSEDETSLKGPCHPKLSFSMFNSHGHWLLWHRSFVPESTLKKENAFFQKFLEIVCI